MRSVTATTARKDFLGLMDQVNQNCEPIAIANPKGKGAVLVGEDDWAAIEETLYAAGVLPRCAGPESGHTPSPRPDGE